MSTDDKLYPKEPEGTSEESIENEDWLKAAAKAPSHLFSVSQPTLSAGTGYEDTLPPPSAPSAKQGADEDGARYQQEGEVARGGLGRIIRARDKRLDRPVALKELLRQDSRLEERFVREALLTAKLEHPGIVPVHDLGMNSLGSPYYAMKLIDGRSLDQIIAEKKTLAERLSLLQNVTDVCDALGYAHSKKIIHRDLKPQNILIGSFGETVVVDWGLAKKLDEEAPCEEGGEDKDKSPYRGIPNESLTLDGSVMGTPAYMPREQALGKSVDETADVYSLGAILYQILGGAPPYTGRSSEIILRQVILREPPSLDERQPGLPEDLLAIVKKAMAREPKDRYPTAKEMAEDLKRFQTGQIVGVYQYSSTELFMRWLRRHKIVLTASLAALLVTSVAIYWDRSQLEDDRSQLRVSLQKTTEEKEQATKDKQSANDAKLEAEKERSRATSDADKAKLEQARLFLEHSPWRTIEVLDSLSSSFAGYSKVRTIAADALSRGVPKLIRAHKTAVSDLEFSPDGATLASSGADGTLQLWDAKSRALLKTFEGHTQAIQDISFSPDGSRLASADATGAIWLWEVSSGKGKELKGHALFVNQIAFSNDGKTLYSCGGEGAIRIWSVESGEVVTLQASKLPMLTVVLSPNGETLASAGKDGLLHLWQLPSLKEGSTRDTIKGFSSPRFSPDGKLLAFLGDQSKDGWTIRIKALDGGASRELIGHKDFITNLSFSLDGRRLASLDVGGLIRLWSVASGELLGTYSGAMGVEGDFASLAFSPSGSLAFHSKQGDIYLLEDEAFAPRPLSGHQGGVTVLRFSPDGKTLASAGQDGIIQLHPISFLEQNVFATGGAFSKDGQLFAVGKEDHSIELLDRETGASQKLLGHTAQVSKVYFSPDGARLVSFSDDDKTLRLWSLHDGTSALLKEDLSRIYWVDFSSDSAFFAVATAQSLSLWSLQKGVSLKTLEEHTTTNNIYPIKFSPDGRFLFSLNADHRVRLWNTSTGEGHTVKDQTSTRQCAFSLQSAYFACTSVQGSVSLWEIKGGEAKPFKTLQTKKGGLGLAIAFSPDGKTLAASGSQLPPASIHLWDIESGEEIVFSGHQGLIWDIKFSPDGKTLASSSDDNTVRLWDISEWRSSSRIEHRALYHKNAGFILFLLSGDALISYGLDGSVRLWSDDLPHDPTTLRAKLKELASQI